MLTTLWFGKLKPHTETYLTPFVQEMEQLAAEGFTWKDGNSGWVKRTKVVAAVCIADTVCRSMLRNCTQFNGRFGCDWCYHPGVTVAKGLGHARVYPYEEHDLRTTDEHHTGMLIKLWKKG